MHSGSLGSGAACFSGAPRHGQRTEKEKADALVTTLWVATKESWKNGDGVWQSRSEWHRVVLFGGLAECARTLTKGSLVMVQGAVRSREYEKDGIKHRVFEVRAETIGKLDRAEREESRGQDVAEE